MNAISIFHDTLKVAWEKNFYHLERFCSNAASARMSFILSFIMCVEHLPCEAFTKLHLFTAPLMSQSFFLWCP